MDTPSLTPFASVGGPSHQNIDEWNPFGGPGLGGYPYTFNQGNLMDF
jgi:hypothetical protein